MNCRLSVKLLRFVELPAEKDLLALQIGNGLLNHSAQKAASKLAFGVM